MFNWVLIIPMIKCLYQGTEESDVAFGLASIEKKTFIGLLEL